MAHIESKENPIENLNKDITTRHDIVNLITAFYKKAMVDEEISHFFHEEVHRIKTIIHNSYNVSAGFF